MQNLSTVHREQPWQDNSSMPKDPDEFMAAFQVQMETVYGGLFTTRVDSSVKLKAWESRWRETFRGKTRKRITSAINMCFDRHPHIWTPAEFLEAYKALSRDEPQTNLLEHHKHDPEGRQRAQDAAASLAKGTGAHPLRTLRNIDSGAWTGDMERGFQKHAAILELSKKYPEATCCKT